MIESNTPLSALQKPSRRWTLYLESRKKTGEELKGNSPLFRLWFDEYKGNAKVAPVNDVSMSRYMMKLWGRSMLQDSRMIARGIASNQEHIFRREQVRQSMLCTAPCSPMGESREKSISTTQSSSRRRSLRQN